MDVKAIIPARFASTRLPGKPLKVINGKSMIEWVYSQASKASTVSEVVVATDDERIRLAVLAFGGRVVMTSPNCRTGTERSAEALKDFQSPPDIIVNIQGDEPLIEPELIDLAVEPLIKDTNLEMATAMTLIKDSAECEDPNVVKVVTDNQGNALYFSRSNIPAVTVGCKDAKTYKHIGIYVYRMDFLLKIGSLVPTPLEKAERLEQLRVLENGYKIRVVETDYNPIAVDTEEDLLKVRELLGD